MIIKSFPTLFGLAKKDTIKQWSIRVEDNGGAAKIITETGLLDGKKQEFITDITQGKNIGKSNETTPIEQALAEAESKWKKKIKEGYSEDGKPSRPLYPMLAHDYKKHKNKVVYPVYVQPKLNGVRCLAIYNGTTVKFISRTGKEFETLDHIEQEIIELFPDKIILDGELYNHELNFQSIIKRVKRVKTSRNDIDNTLLQYWIYDCINEDCFCDRIDLLEEFIFNNTNLELTPTYHCKNEDELKTLHTDFVQDGYEGSIIRSPLGKYQIKHRSYDLLKYKDFLDEEFEICGVNEGVGKDAGMAIFVVKNNVGGGEEFKVRPRGNNEQRKKWWDERDQLIGKTLTVRFQERSEDRIPIFPVGLCIRDYE